jgi:hypothetical protein
LVWPHDPTQTKKTQDLLGLVWVVWVVWVKSKKVQAKAIGAGECYDGIPKNFSSFFAQTTQTTQTKPGVRRVSAGLG